MLLYLLGADENRLRGDDQITGKAVENFVAIELVRHADSSEQNPEVFHYRRDRDELDLAFDNRAGEICAIEVKSSSKVREKGWAALQRLRARDRRASSAACSSTPEVRPSSSATASSRSVLNGLLDDPRLGSRAAAGIS